MRQDALAPLEITPNGDARLFVVSYPLDRSPVNGALRYAFYSLTWLSGGAATFVCDAEQFAVAPASLIWTVPGQVHWWEQPAQGAHITMIGFMPEIFAGSPLDVHLITDLPFLKPDGNTVVAAPGEVGEALDNLFKHIWQRYLQTACS